MGTYHSQPNSKVDVTYDVDVRTKGALFNQKATPTLPKKARRIKTSVTEYSFRRTTAILYLRG